MCDSGLADSGWAARVTTESVGSLILMMAASMFSRGEVRTTCESGVRCSGTSRWIRREFGAPRRWPDQADIDGTTVDQCCGAGSNHQRTLVRVTFECFTADTN